MKNKSKTVLVVAYACEPGKTSEPGVGWYFTREIAKNFQTLVLTRTNNREVIEKEPKKGIEYLYYDLPELFKTIKKKLPLGTQMYYALWQWGAYFSAKRQLKKSGVKVDLLHHLNFAASWIAPPAYLLKTPFIWGPVGGGDTIPYVFLRKMRFMALLQEGFYYGINTISRLSPFSFFTRKKAGAVLFRTASAQNIFRKIGPTLTQIISETASSELIERPHKTISTDVHAICVGRMNYWKGFLFAVQGFHEFLQKGGVGTLEIFGEGTEQAKIEKYIEDNKLQKSIFVKGFVPNPIIKEKMAQATLLIHPSFREGGSWAIMEAMSFGLPVICLNTSGPKDMVTDQCGVLIELISPRQVAADIGEGLLALQVDKDRYMQLSKNAIERIQKEYNWNKRREQLTAVYTRMLQG